MNNDTEVIKKIGIKNSSGGYDYTDLGADAENVINAEASGSGANLQQALEPIVAKMDTVQPGAEPNVFNSVNDKQPAEDSDDLKLTAMDIKADSLSNKSIGEQIKDLDDNKNKALFDENNNLLNLGDETRPVYFEDGYPKLTDFCIRVPNPYHFFTEEDNWIVDMPSGIIPAGYEIIDVCGCAGNQILLSLKDSGNNATLRLLKVYNKNKIFARKNSSWSDYYLKKIKCLNGFQHLLGDNGRIYITPYPDNLTMAQGGTKIGGSSESETKNKAAAFTYDPISNNFYFVMEDGNGNIKADYIYINKYHYGGKYYRDPGYWGDWTKTTASAAVSDIPGHIVDMELGWGNESNKVRLIVDNNGTKECYSFSTSSFNGITKENDGPTALTYHAMTYNNNAQRTKIATYNFNISQVFDNIFYGKNTWFGSLYDSTEEKSQWYIYTGEGNFNSIPGLIADDRNMRFAYANGFLLGFDTNGTKVRGIDIGDKVNLNGVSAYLSEHGIIL